MTGPPFRWMQPVLWLLPGAAMLGAGIGAFMAWRDLRGGGLGKSTCEPASCDPGDRQRESRAFAPPRMRSRPSAAVRPSDESHATRRPDPEPPMKRLTRDWFYVAMAAITLLAIAVGFGRTYAAPMVAGTFHGPMALHVHGAFALGWVLLFLAQPLLVRGRRIAAHRRVGRIGFPLAVGVAVTMVPAGVHQVTRDLADGVGEEAVSAMVCVVTSAVMFVVLVACGIVARRDREAHARWLLLATLLVAWPAWFRWRHWFPSVPRPDIWFGVVIPDSWILIAMLRDRITRGGVHPVLGIAGSAIVLENWFEVLAFDTQPWRDVAHAIYGWLHP